MYLIFSPLGRNGVTVYVLSDHLV